MKSSRQFKTFATTSRSSTDSHHCEGDEEESREAHVDLHAFCEPLRPVDVETQSAGSHDSKQDEQSAAQPDKALQTFYTL